MKADAHHRAMTRLGLFLVVAITALAAAVPALAFDGARNDYTQAGSCAGAPGFACHDTGGIGPEVFPGWTQTGHASEGSYANSQANAYPVGRGPSCAGCHAGNYDPTKAVPSTSPVPTPSPTPTATATAFYYPPAIPIWPSPVDNAYTPESFTASPTPGASPVAHNNVAVIGCSSCHYNANTGHDPATYLDLANPQICGQCHDRYAYNTNVYVVPTPRATSLNNFHPEYPVALNPFTNALTSQMQIPTPGVSPPTANRWLFWQGGQSRKSHGEGAVQYAEWVQGTWNGVAGDPIDSLHPNGVDTLRALKPFIPDTVLNTCLECHSADYRIVQEWNTEHPASPRTLPDINTAKYGVTCQACHVSHEEGPTASTWNEERNPQLRAPQTELCTECHTGEIPQGTEYTPGDEVHHPMKEMMAGYGAIGVPENPSPHQGKCVECHMVPTGYENSGLRGTSANHRFMIIEPEEAASQTTAVTVSGVTTNKQMPYSSCSTCHGSPDDPLATHLQDLIDFRQQWMADKVTQVGGELDAAGVRLGYADGQAAYDAIMAKPPADRTSAEVTFLSAWTNREFVETEGSMAIHNWDYARQTVEVALLQAKSAPWTPYALTISSSKAKVTAGKTVTITGTVVPVDFAAGPLVRLQRKGGGAWKTVKSVAPLLPGGMYTIKYKVRMGSNYLRTTFSSSTGRPQGYSKQIKVVGK